MGGLALMGSIPTRPGRAPRTLLSYTGATPVMPGTRRPISAFADGGDGGDGVTGGANSSPAVTVGDGTVGAPRVSVGRRW